MNNKLNSLVRPLSGRILPLIFRSILFTALFLPIASPASPALAATTPVTVTITELDQTGDNFDLTTLGDFYAKVSINGSDFETGELSHLPPEGYLVPTGNLLPSPWVITANVPSDAATVPVTIVIKDSDFPDPDDTADINPGPGEGISLEVDMATGKWTGDVNWPQSCVGTFDLDEDSASICFDISVLSANGDADQDGLPDGWEQNGYNADADSTIDIDLPALGADPLRKDVFVEVDYLVAAGHSHFPRSDAITDAVQSFANAPVLNPDGTTGVQLHVDVGPLYGAGTIVPVLGIGGVSGNYGDLGGGGSQIPEAGNEIIESFGAPLASATKFSALREDFFESRRGYVFRYAIFGHQTNVRKATNDCTSGEANGIPGLQFMVTLGGVDSNGNACSGTDANGFSVGTRFEQAGTFMHELGHTLGLHHGGDENTNKKPNYLSVMSYAFQDCQVPASPNGLLPGGCDYSRIDLPDLTETSLDECTGLDSGLLGFGLNDWDGDGTIEGASNCLGNNVNSTADTNNDGICVEPGTNGTRDSTLVGDDFRDREKVTDGKNRVCDSEKMGDDIQKTAVGDTPSQPNTMKGSEDWNTLTYSLLAIAGAGSSGSSPVEDEPDPETIRESREYLGNLLAPGVVVIKTGPATAVPGDLLTYTVEISNEVSNEGRGPALQVVLTDNAPDGSSQVSDLGAVVLGELVTRTSNFTVPLNACPGDFTGATALVNFEDFVGHQLTASGSAPLEILDIAPPVLSLAVSPATLWPPDHKFKDVSAAITVTDNCDPDPTITLISVISNEPESGFLGSGDKGPDVQGAVIGTDDRSFSLRAERGTSGHSTGRIYTITYRATDASGNVSEAAATVTVPTNSSGIH